MSVSKKQLIANRANAQLSTGPNTDEGKDIAGQNAVKHGLYAHYLLITQKTKKQQNKPILV